MRADNNNSDPTDLESLTSGRQEFETNPLPPDFSSTLSSTTPFSTEPTNRGEVTLGERNLRRVWALCEALLEDTRPEGVEKG